MLLAGAALLAQIDSGCRGVDSAYLDQAPCVFLMMLCEGGRWSDEALYFALAILRRSRLELKG